jgi:hypothetical protein
MQKKYDKGMLQPCRHCVTVNISISYLNLHRQNDNNNSSVYCESIGIISNFKLITVDRF